MQMVNTEKIMNETKQIIGSHQLEGELWTFVMSLDSAKQTKLYCFKKVKHHLTNTLLHIMSFGKFTNFQDRMMAKGNIEGWIVELNSKKSTQWNDRIFEQDLTPAATVQLPTVEFPTALKHLSFLWHTLSTKLTSWAKGRPGDRLQRHIRRKASCHQRHQA
eukprot:TRINITY_DN525_c1_g2_i2.p1 TRINITY_DN525_c1_g2~~TRINITY_DN525_c1_g2_i2.p1  ORF type:complete len:161 (+),score=30.10 TRINITY_DN525_c1_g2_i2:220-702(+)